MFAAGKTMVEALLIIDEKARRFLIRERREARIFTALTL